MKIPDFVKQNSKFLITVVILTALPFIFYFVNFHGLLSNDHAIWGTFGDFVGGFLNTILTFILILFTTWSYYESQKMVQKIHEETKDLQKLVHEEAISLQKNQYKPLIRLRYENFKDKFLLKIVNHGLGPLVIKNIFFYKNENLQRLDDDLYETLENFNLYFRSAANYNKIIIDPNSNEAIIEIDFHGDEDKIKDQKKKIFDTLYNYRTEVFYTDIFDNTYPIYEVRFNNLNI